MDNPPDSEPSIVTQLQTKVNHLEDEVSRLRRARRIVRSLGAVVMAALTAIVITIFWTEHASRREQQPEALPPLSEATPPPSIEAINGALYRVWFGTNRRPHR